jgi:hypothetical protein
MEKQINFGVASFVYILQLFGKDCYLVSKTVIALTLSDKRPYHVEIRYKNKKPVSCGYIVIDEKTLQDLFGDDTTAIREFSERNNGTFGLEHCSISKDPEKRGKKLTDLNGEDFFCLITEDNSFPVP